jgi:hypothetical protein
MNDHSYKYHNLVNCPPVICLPCHLPSFKRDTSSELMAPGSILHEYFLLKKLLLLFTSFYLPLPLSIYLFAFSLVTSKDKGLDNPLAALGASILFCLCVGATYLVSLKLLLVR